MSPNPHNTPSNQSELRDEIQDFCFEYALVLDGNGEDYMSKWFNRNYDRIESLIESQRTEAQKELLDELVYLVNSEAPRVEDQSWLWNFIANKREGLTLRLDQTNDNDTKGR